MLVCKGLAPWMFLSWELSSIHPSFPMDEPLLPKPQRLQASHLAFFQGNVFLCKPKRN